MGEWCLDGQLRCTRFRAECPECGRVGVAMWTFDLNVARCLGCGARFDPYKHAYRPVTGGMTDEEREAYLREQQRECARRRYADPDVRARKLLYMHDRCTTDEYRRMRRERYACRSQDERDRDHERRARRWASMTPEQRERKRERDRDYYREHREDILLARNRRNLEAMRDDR